MRHKQTLIAYNMRTKTNYKKKIRIHIYVKRVTEVRETIAETDSRLSSEWLERRSPTNKISRSRSFYIDAPSDKRKQINSYVYRGKIRVREIAWTRGVR